MRRMIGLLALFALGAGERMVEPAHGVVVLQGVNLGWTEGASRVRRVSAGVDASSKDPATLPTGQGTLLCDAQSAGKASATLRYADLATPRPVMRGTETLTLSGHRDKDPQKRQPAVRTSTVLVELPEGSPPSAAVWLSGIRLELGAAHPSGVALQALGVTTSAPVVAQNHARFELTVTLESGEGAAGVPDPVDYQATVSVDWALIPAEPGAVGRLDHLPEGPLGEPSQLSWVAPAGTSEVFAGLSGFSFALADEVVGSRRTLDAVVVELTGSLYDPTEHRWSGELALNLVSRLPNGKVAPTYGQATVSLLALGEQDRSGFGLWLGPKSGGAESAAFPFAD